MILYHGSNVVITNIDLSLSKPGKDFGKGFYLNPNFKQAQNMAQRAVSVLGQGEVVVNAFEFDEDILNHPDKINFKVFSDYSDEWADFIVANRRNRSNSPIHNYDIVIGPIADDTVGVQIRRYIQGYLPVEQLIKELRFHGDKAIQYYFSSERAIKLLKPLKL